MMKKLTVFILLACLVVGLVGCGSSDASSSNLSDAETQASVETQDEEDTLDAEADEEEEGEEEVSDALAKYREEGFIIGADLFAPYIYEDDDGEMTGVDYDILVAILTELGIEDITVKSTAYESVILELNNGNVDCTCDGMYITEERMAQGVYFSDVIYYENDCILISADSDITTVEDLSDKTMAVCTGAVAVELAEEMLANGEIGGLDYYTSNDLTFAAVSSGQADCVLCDCFAASPAMSEDSSYNLAYLEDYEPQLSDAVAGFGFRTEDAEFVEEFNEVLNAMKEDGRLQEIFDKYNMSSSVFCGVEEGKVTNLTE